MFVYFFVCVCVRVRDCVFSCVCVCVSAALAPTAAVRIRMTGGSDPGIHHMPHFTEQIGGNSGKSLIVRKSVNLYIPAVPVFRAALWTEERTPAILPARLTFISFIYLYFVRCRLYVFVQRISQDSLCTYTPVFLWRVYIICVIHLFCFIKYFTRPLSTGFSYLGPRTY